MDQEQRNKILSDAAGRIKRAAYDIEEPIEINGLIPDLYGIRRLAARRKMKIIVKIETEESIKTQEARSTMVAFAEWAEKYGSRLAVVFVPKGCGPLAREHLSKYNETYEYE